MSAMMVKDGCDDGGGWVRWRWRMGAKMVDDECDDGGKWLQ